jgi:hypothetical protein
MRSLQDPNSTGTYFPHASGKLHLAPGEPCNVFIAYRAGPDEGDACASWLHENLEGVDVSSAQGASSKVVVYWAGDAAAIDDWRMQWRTALKACHAMVLVCTPGTRRAREGQDWLFEEINWWTSTRRTAPILINACGGKECVPTAVASKWPYAQRLSWSDAHADGPRLLRQIRDGIALSESGVRNEALAKSLRKTRMLLGLAVALVLSVAAEALLLVSAFVAGGCASSQFVGRFSGREGPRPPTEGDFVDGLDCLGGVIDGLLRAIPLVLLTHLAALVTAVVTATWSARYVFRRMRHRHV